MQSGRSSRTVPVTGFLPPEPDPVAFLSLRSSYVRQRNGIPPVAVSAPPAGSTIPYFKRSQLSKVSQSHSKRHYQSPSEPPPNTHKNTLVHSRFCHTRAGSRKYIVPLVVDPQRYNVLPPEVRQTTLHGPVTAGPAFVGSRLGVESFHGSPTRVCSPQKARVLCGGRLGPPGCSLG